MYKRQTCAGLSCRELPVPSRTVVTSGIQWVEFGKQPVIIGERINPTGKPKFKQALRDHDIPYVLREGLAQQDAGAHVLDVNVGLPEIDEPALMCQVVEELQAVSSLPLQIDTSDPVSYTHLDVYKRQEYNDPAGHSVPLQRSAIQYFVRETKNGEEILPF